MAEARESLDPASQSVLDRMRRADVGGTAWDRLSAQAPHCGFGTLGICCRICYMGPCRIDPFGDGPQYGACGADADTIAARNFARMVAGGAAAHSDHGRDVAHTFLLAAKGEASGYEIKDTVKLRAVAGFFGVATEGRSTTDIAIEVGEKALAEFGKPHGTQHFIKRAPKRRQQRWADLGVEPRAVDREICEVMHRTHIGVDQEYRSIMRQAIRCSLADGWGGSMIATDLQDILFRTPYPIRATCNLGVLKEDEVNIVIHGHEPILSELIVVVSQEQEMLDLAKSKGAKGINLAGICCTANEILMRHGIPIAGNFLQQELAIGTGAVEAMVVDVQCIMQGLGRLSKRYHTELITTSPKGQIAEATYIAFDEANALESARAIVRAGIENFPNRKGDVYIPDESELLIGGFTDESVMYTLGGTFRASYRPLNDNIINGRIRGIAGVVGCNNPKMTHDEWHVESVKELIARDVLVLQTGCAAIACAKAGLMKPEAALEFAGPGLREVCETAGIPPVLHCGSCVDNSRLLIAASNVVAEGGLGEDISDLPLAGSAPEWMSEKAISIGQYFVASGVYTVFGVGLPVTGAPNLTRYLFEEMEQEYGARWDVADGPSQMAQKMIDHIEAKRETLGINVEAERKLFDMADRRALEIA